MRSHVWYTEQGLLEMDSRCPGQSDGKRAGNGGGVSLFMDSKVQLSPYSF